MADYNYRRIKTQIVKVGKTTIGGNSSICIQSMTNTANSEIDLTVEQCKRIFDNGAELVRITVPSTQEANAIIKIIDKLRKDGYKKAISADVHFKPELAEQIAEYVDKVRINPGNYYDKKSDKINLSESEYKQELKNIRERLIPLIKKCKKHNTAIRIGTNHGSLSGRILSKYGDTPQGMVESTMEFLRILADEDFYDVVVSLKSSNTRVMVYANRLLVKQIKSEDLYFPIHLGVTEAGEGEDGRIKSSVGIGTLLNEGIGDTIRVSLTEDPENEIPVCKKLIRCVDNLENHKEISLTEHLPYNPFSYSRRKSYEVLNIAGKNVPVVIADFSSLEELKNKDLISLGYSFINGEYNKTGDQCPDYIYIGSIIIDSKDFKGISFISDFDIWLKHYQGQINIYPIYSSSAFITESEYHSKLSFLNITLSALSDKLINKIKDKRNLVLISDSENENMTGEQKALISKLNENNCFHPVIPHKQYSVRDIEDLQIQSSFDFGSLFIDGLADGIMISAKREISNKQVASVAFGILQAARIRITKTEYISCPGCGRTLFDLQEVTAKIQAETSHLKTLKIGIMGCIVNGPGEMADADYGYVGSGRGKISLYKKQSLVKRNIPTKDALSELIKIIKENGDWINKEEF